MTMLLSSRVPNAHPLPLLTVVNNLSLVPLTHSHHVTIDHSVSSSSTENSGLLVQLCTPHKLQIVHKNSCLTDHGREGRMHPSGWDGGVAVLPYDRLGCRRGCEFSGLWDP
ncbi:hypothetical protein BZA05DRAFT_398599 [Tricharina praecox]|uniref:uncharacterized protein n=1 Tax=Tricharina praecox TaxID=43433 RepID=UPI00221FE293|nr:uncharacterized protein BZA05DRAFT_398599 [Tricharina praecox]KAI5851996.1 hypothetical protein BZA05DRAFT_398599 [Tricharina praecox]